MTKNSHCNVSATTSTGSTGLNSIIKRSTSKIKLGDIEPEADQNGILEEETKEEADTRKVKIKSLINGVLDSTKKSGAKIAPPEENRKN